MVKFEGAGGQIDKSGFVEFVRVVEDVVVLFVVLGVPGLFEGEQVSLDVGKGTVGLGLISHLTII